MILKEDNNKKVYSDGETTEKRILDIAKQYPEDMVEEYIANNSEYILNNTFSAVRQNILNWYNFKPDSEILEVGAGMGSLTGLLCNKAKHVTAVEMSPTRAEIIRTRYSTRNNLEVISESITEWKTTKKFDYVVFIGVLEYAAIFSDKKNPYDEFLKCVKKYIKENGKILFAIENRFGLKYWAGGSEDHLQKPFVGIDGYTDKKGPRTFSENELKEMLNRVGLKNHRFYYVYPDYKFPEIICSEDKEPEFRNLQKVSFTYSKNSTLVFNEKNLYKDIVENNVWRFFANSFLVEASESTLEQKHAVYVSAKSEVHKKYRVSTVIYNDDSVEKVSMHKDAKQHISDIYDNTLFLKERGVKILDLDLKSDRLWCKKHIGVGAQDYFCELLKENDREGLIHLTELLKNALIKSSDLSDEKKVFDGMELDIPISDVGEILEKGFIDMTFYNAFYEGDDLLFYDQEWCFENTPLNFILYYAISSVYNRAQVQTDVQLEEFWRYLNIEHCIDAFKQMESYVWSKILYRQTDLYGDGGYCNRYSDELTYQKMFDDLQAEKTELFRDREILLKETERLNSEINTLNDDKSHLIDEVGDLKQEVLNKQGHIELLLPVEREYEAVKRSLSFRTMRFFCRILDIILYVPKIVAKKLLAFAKMLSHVNIPKLKIAAGYVKEEGLVGAYHHLMRDYHQGELKDIQINVEEKTFEEITDLNQCETLEFKEEINPEVSIVIPVYNQFTYTYYCLKSILENSGDVSYEIIIADDCSNDLTTDIKSVAKNIKVVKTEQNMLFLRNCNNAAKYATGKYILFLNNDTQVQENWLRPLVDLCEKDSTIGMTGSKLVYSDGTLQEAGGIIWNDASGWNYGRNMNAMAPEYNYVKDVDYISGAAIMIRASLWKELGGFDEYFAPAYYEDSDLAFQVRKAGYRVVYQPQSVVVHFEGKSNGTDLNAGVKKHQVENQLKFRKKWADVLEKEQLTNGTNVYLAKDRGQTKKQILVVDHYVPHYDKDAGGRCTYMYLKLFVKLGFKVTFIGDNFFQHEPYTTELTQMGIEVLYGNYYAQNWQQWLKENLHYFDYIYLQRPHISIKYIDLVKKYAKGKIFYFAHDLHFLRLTRDYELTKNPESLEQAEKFRKDEFYLFDKADVVHVVGSYEQEYLQKELPNKVVRNIPLYIYEELPDNINKDFSTRNDIMFVGGFGHTPNIDAVLWFAKEVFPKIVAKYPDIVWHIIGGKATKEILQLASKNIVIDGFVSDEELDVLYRKCRMAVVPLRVGAGVKGKVVEAAYYQIPLVTTSIGGEGISHEEGAFIIEDDADKMAQVIIDLYEDYDELKKISDNGIEFIKNHFMLDHAEEVLKMDL